MFWQIKTTVPFVFCRSRSMKIETHSSAAAPQIQRAQMTSTVQLHYPINDQIGSVDNQSDSRILL